jgi:cytochrome b561
MPGSARKYDRVTLWLHAALALGVLIQLSLSAVMHVPAGPGLGVRDWHREAFEVHARTGLFVVVVCALHWLWLCLPHARPGIAPLFPWLKRDNRIKIVHEFRDLISLHTSSSLFPSPLAGTVQGLGLLAVSGSASGGIINYLGYFVGVPIPRTVLHWVSLSHILFGYAIWLFVVGHVTMALLHWQARARRVRRQPVGS